MSAVEGSPVVDHSAVAEGTALPEELSRILEEKAQLAGATLPDLRRVSLADATVSALSWPGITPGAPYPVFLHGNGLNAHTWDSVILRLGGGALALDLPGHGDSAWREDYDYSPQSLAETLNTALTEWEQRTGAGQRQLIGHSLGGITAIHLAALAPERTRSLALVDITPGSSAATGSSRVREFLAGPESFASVAEIGERALHYGIGHDRASLERGATLNTRRGPDGRLRWKHHLARLLHEGVTPSPIDLPGAWAPWDALEVPATLLRGNSGMVTEEQANTLLSRHPGTTVTVLSGGHNIHEDDPEGSAGALRYFLRDCAPTPRP